MRYELYDHYGKFMGCNIAPCDCKANAPKRVDMDDYRWRLLLLYDKETLLEEIANLAYTCGEAHKKDTDEGRKEHRVLMYKFFDQIEGGNIKRVDRTLVLALQRCERLLHRWTKYPKLKRNASFDNQRDRKQELTMELRVSDNVSETIATSLLNLVNEFIEVFVLRDWAGITYKDGYDYWDLRLRETEQQMIDCLEMEDDDDAVLYTGW